MSTPRARQIHEVFDRVLARYAQLSGAGLAATLGVADSYVTKLRGGWRPTRVRDDLMEKLSALDPGAASSGAAFERPPAWGDESRDFYRGMQAAALRMMRTVVDLQTEIGEALRTPADAAPAKRTSPTAGEIAVGLEVLRAVDAAAVSARRGKSG